MGDLTCCEGQFIAVDVFCGVIINISNSFHDKLGKINSSQDFFLTLGTIPHCDRKHPPVPIAMDSELTREGRLMDLVDDAWKNDTLPCDDIAVPQMELPELEADNGNSMETLHEQEQKWLDMTTVHEATIKQSSIR